ncbi:MAG: TOMM precursor leader peptide-binding protein [Deltaproteobacteria bacterium]|nr:TOMM precursor leader peptide-binding protein [Deltaproteobacteria bacterium]
MANDPTLVPLKALPAQFVQTADGAVLSRGCVQVKISGERAADTVKAVLTLATEEGASKEQICEFFAAPDRPAVAALVDQLLTRRILVPADTVETSGERVEGTLDIFYWHFGEKTSTVTERLNEKQIVVLGVNAVARQIVSALRAVQAENVTVIDYPLLRNLRFFDNGVVHSNEWLSPLPRPVSYQEWAQDLDPQSFDCLVATSDFGGFQVMREWNEFCVSHQRHFLPIMLDNLIGYVGPFVIPGETACYECLYVRENANADEPQLKRSVEAASIHHQAVTGFHPSMASVLGDIAALELTKFYGGLGGVPWRVGAVIEVSLLAADMKARKLLKVPRCAVCSPVRTRSTTTPNKSAFMPGHDWNVITGEQK